MNKKHKLDDSTDIWRECLEKNVQGDRQFEFWNVVKTWHLSFNKDKC